MLVLIQQAALLIGTLLAAITDAKTGYIYDWITYPLIVVGALTSLLQSQWLNFGIALIVFAALSLAYRAGKLGGGDVKLFTALALLNPSNDYWFLAGIVFFAAASAMIFYGVYYPLAYLRGGHDLRENKKNMLTAAGLALVLALYFGGLITLGLVSAQRAALVAFPLAFGLLFMALHTGISRTRFETTVAVARLEDDEVLADTAKNAAALRALHNKTLIGDAEKAVLKKKGIRRVCVMRNLPPFGPFIFIGVLGALLWPGAVLLMLG